MYDYKELQVRGDRKKKTRLRMGGGQLHPISMLFCVVTRTLNYVPDYLHAVKEVAVDDSISKILEMFPSSIMKLSRAWFEKMLTFVPCSSFAKMKCTSLSIKGQIINI